MVPRSGPWSTRSTLPLRGFHSWTVSFGPVTAIWFTTGFHAAWAESPLRESITIRSGACASACRSACTPVLLVLICVDWSASDRLCCGSVARSAVAWAASERDCADWYWVYAMSAATIATTRSVTSVMAALRATRTVRRCCRTSSLEIASFGMPCSGAANSATAFRNCGCEIERSLDSFAHRRSV